MFYSCIAMMDGITVALLSHISTLHIQLYSAQRDSATPEFLSIRAKTQSGRAASSCRSQSERNQATLLEAVRRAKEVVSKPIARQIHAKLTASGIALMLSAVKWSCSAVQSQLWQQPSRVERDEDGGSACSSAIVTPTDVPDFCAAAPEVVADIMCEVASHVRRTRRRLRLSLAPISPPLTRQQQSARGRRSRCNVHNRRRMKNGRCSWRRDGARQALRICAHPNAPRAARGIHG